MSIPRERIRNFCIIAHIDHGKSTLADRLLAATGALTQREEREQFLDKMDIERERGITIKAQAVRLVHRAEDGLEYMLNLVDTPGHVDFGYEVSRSLAACDGALLVVDASQGVEAQTLANVYLAVANDLEIVPVLNKIDLPAAEPDRVAQEIEEVVGLDTEGILHVSAKTGLGVEALLERLVALLPGPQGAPADPFRALIFDSWYDPYKGVVLMVRVVDGSLKVGDDVTLMHTQARHQVLELGAYNPHAEPLQHLETGEIGYVVAGIKDLHDAKVGDTLCLTASKGETEVVPGFEEVKPMVFAGIFPVDAADYSDLRDALDKLVLNDASLVWEPESSAALGLGFRCGFLGLLHMEIVQERLEREFNLDLLTTAPTVVYRRRDLEGNESELSNPADFPQLNEVEAVLEPMIRADIHVPEEFVGSVMKLCQERRGVQLDLQYLTSDRVHLQYRLPLAEVVFDFFDHLKSITRGYASMDYELSGYEESDLVRLDVLINSERVDALAVILHKDNAYFRGRALCKKLRELIPRAQFKIPIQASIGSRIIARETIPALRKDVTSKCYGGDISRKRKLLEKQKKGKKRMRQFGKVEIPQSAFLSVLKTDV
ncbi:MAG: elongation factor 4 [Myxococcales bacterium]|nr:elongation factor 4 [Myxococcales bacterium]